MHRASSHPIRDQRRLADAAGRVVVMTTLLFALGGCAISRTDGPALHPQDPWVSMNRPVFSFNQRVDRVAFKPMAKTYRFLVPDFMERMVFRFFYNLRGPVSSLSGFLQGKPERGVKAGWRFVINSTFGIAGLFDPATSMGLEDQAEDLGQVFATWGWDDSPYVVLPLAGPTTLVEIPDMAIDVLTVRWLFGDQAMVAGGTRALSLRAQALTLTDFLDSSAVDPYVFTRDAYLQRRRSLLYDGEPSPDALDEIFDDF